MHEKVLESFGLNIMKDLNGFHNQVFLCQHDQQLVTVRITPVNVRRTFNQLNAEIQFLDMCQSGLNTIEPYTIKGSSIHQIEGYFYVFFKYIEGDMWYECEHDDETYFMAGKNLGYLHQVSQKVPKLNRASYVEHPDVELARALDDVCVNALEDVLDKMNKWDKGGQDYGIIHGDYLFSNMVYSETVLSVIDFDDIEYNFYLYDIAVYLFYYLLGGNPGHIDIEPNIELFKAFMKGYRSVQKTVHLEFSHLQTLFKLREIKLYATIMQSTQRGDWQTAYLKKAKDDFKHNREFVDIDYVALYNTLL
jgi:Ser/Thr protein kinase RdoA (MazF antagonist)